MGTPGFQFDALGLLAALALVLANAYFVATEFALVAVRRSELALWVEQGRRGAASAKLATDHIDGAVAACQLGITVASIGLGWIGEQTVVGLVEPMLHLAGVGRLLAVHTVAATVAFGAITFLHVVVGELAPKALALDRPGEIALWCARPLLVFGRIFRVVLVAMNASGNLLLRALGVSVQGGAHRVHSAEELSYLVRESEAAGAIRPSTGRILGNVFRASRRRVRDVMVPRERVFAVERHLDAEAILERLREEGYTRLPVYDGDLDHVVGILHTKDLFHLYAKTRLVVLQDAIRPGIEMRPDLPMGEALRVFRRGRRHMALVREPGGPLLGLLTLEDILEEIVGEIEDEHDEPTPAGVE